MTADGLDKSRIANDAIKLWHGEPGSLQYVGESESYVCCFMATGRKLYMRLTSPSHRMREQIEAELSFLAHLQQGGIALAAPVVSVNGRALESLGNGSESWYAVVFEEAEGEIFSFGSDDEANRRHFRLRGEVLGAIHRLSGSYSSSANGHRFRWHEDPVFTEIDSYLPASETVVWGEYARLMTLLQDRPESKESFGLIHGDFGATNFRCLGDQLTVFDFDDCCHHWYAYDLAITLYPHGWRTGAAALLDALLEGYSKQGTKYNQLRDDVIDFCGLRLLYLFLNNARNWGFTDLTAEQEKWFSQKRENIARGYILHA